jgi:hypothetical protein
MNPARHDPDAYFESQGGWPADWPGPPDREAYERWLQEIDHRAPQPQPEDLGEPCGSWFTDDPPKAA